MAADPVPRGPLAFRVAALPRWGDRLARGSFLLAGLSVLAVLGFIIYVLVGQSIEFFRDVSIVEFLTGDKWETAGTVTLSEGGDPGDFGIRPLVQGTLLVTVGALAIGLPLGLATAVYLSEYATPRVRALVKPSLELLAGIPSIVFGFFAVLVISPIVQDLSEPGEILHVIFGRSAGFFSAMNSIIVVGVMVIPIIASLSEDALRAVPQHLRDASYGLGATKWETTRSVVVPGAISGIAASFVLGVSRAIGESMAVSMASGTTANLTFNPMDSIQTLTAFIVQRTGGDTPQQGPVFTSLFAAGLTLFVMTLTLNLVAHRFVKRFREVEAN